MPKEFPQKIDRLKRPICVDDFVVFTTGGGHRAATMSLGQVVKWSAQQVQLRSIDIKTGEKSETVRSIAVEKVLVVTEQYKANKQMYPEHFI